MCLYDLYTVYDVWCLIRAIYIYMHMIIYDSSCISHENLYLNWRMYRHMCMYSCAPHLLIAVQVHCGELMALSNLCHKRLGQPLGKNERPKSRVWLDFFAGAGLEEGKTCRKPWVFPLKYSEVSYKCSLKPYFFHKRYAVHIELHVRSSNPQALLPISLLGPLSSSIGQRRWM